MSRNSRSMNDLGTQHWALRTAGHVPTVDEATLMEQIGYQVDASCLSRWATAMTWGWGRLVRVAM